MTVEFCDTNILVYAYDQTDAIKHEQALRLVRRLWTDGTGAVSTQVFSEFYATITRRVPYPLSPQRALGILEDLSSWTVASPTAHSVQTAIRDFVIPRQVSYWDALILQSARELGAEVLWSENFQEGQIFSWTQIRNPFVP